MREGSWRAQRRAADEAVAGLSMALSSFALDVPLEEIRSPVRGRAEAAFARQVAMYLCHVAFARSLSRVAEAFGRDRSTVAHACHMIEDRRDEDAFDLWMGALEEAARAATPAAAISSSEAHTAAAALR